MYKKVVLVIILSFSLLIYSCGNKVDNSKYAVGSKVQYNIDAMEMDSYGDPEARDKNTIYTIKRVIDNGDGTYNYELDKASQPIPEKYLIPAEETDATTENEEKNKETSNIGEKINIFESQDNWHKYVNGNYKNKKVSFEGTIDTDGTPSEDGTLTLYSVSYKTGDGYMMAVIGTITDNKVKKGDKIIGWGLINSSAKSLGAPTIMVMDISKK